MIDLLIQSPIAVILLLLYLAICLAAAVQTVIVSVLALAGRRRFARHRRACPICREYERVTGIDATSCRWFGRER